jgi:hypothetical protein
MHSAAMDLALFDLQTKTHTTGWRAPARPRCRIIASSLGRVCPALTWACGSAASAHDSPLLRGSAAGWFAGTPASGPGQQAGWAPPGVIFGKRQRGSLAPAADPNVRVPGVPRVYKFVRVRKMSQRCAIHGKPRSEAYLQQEPGTSRWVCRSDSQVRDCNRSDRERGKVEA